MKVEPFTELIRSIRLIRGSDTILFRRSPRTWKTSRPDVLSLLYINDRPVNWGNAFIGAAIGAATGGIAAIGRSAAVPGATISSIWATPTVRQVATGSLAASGGGMIGAEGYYVLVDDPEFLQDFWDWMFDDGIFDTSEPGGDPEVVIGEAEPLEYLDENEEWQPWE